MNGGLSINRLSGRSNDVTDDDFDARALAYADGRLNEAVSSSEATRLADRAQEIANMPEQERVAEVSDASADPVAQAVIYRREDGTLSYDAAGDNTVQRYAPGDVIDAADADAVKSLGDAPTGDDGAKQGAKPADKAVTRSRTSNK